MKKSLVILIVGIVFAILISCDQDLDINPQLEEYYRESTRLTDVSLDSVNAFKIKVNEFVKTYPQVQKTKKYSQIQDNIKAASFRLTISINDEWDEEKRIEF